MGLTLLSQPAQAAIITVNSTQYDVTTFTGSYYTDASKFATAANGGLMPWLGDSALAAQFALAVYNLTPTNGGLTDNNADYGSGPLFAHSVSSAPGFEDGEIHSSTENSVVSMNEPWTGIPVGQVYQQGFGGSFIGSFATATVVPTAVPEPLTMLGAATAVGFGAAFKRRLTKANKK